MLTVCHVICFLKAIPRNDLPPLLANQLLWLEVGGWKVGSEWIQSAQTFHPQTPHSYYQHSTLSAWAVSYNLHDIFHISLMFENLHLWATVKPLVILLVKRRGLFKLDWIQCDSLYSCWSMLFHSGSLVKGFLRASTLNLWMMSSHWNARSCNRALDRTLHSFQLINQLVTL